MSNTTKACRRAQIKLQFKWKENKFIERACLTGVTTTNIELNDYR